MRGFGRENVKGRGKRGEGGEGRGSTVGGERKRENVTTLGEEELGRGRRKYL